MYDGPSESEVERVYAEGEAIGFRRAIEALRDEDRYTAWVDMLPMEYWDEPLRQRHIRYLESLDPTVTNGPGNS